MLINLILPPVFLAKACSIVSQIAALFFSSSQIEKYVDKIVSFFAMEANLATHLESRKPTALMVIPLHFAISL